MKNLAIIGLLAFAINMHGQQVEIPIPFSKPSEPKELIIQVFSGNIIIKGTNRSDVLVKYEIEKKEDHGNEEEKRSERNEGMKKIGGNNFNFELGERNNKVSLRSQNWNNLLRLEIEVPSNININIQKQIGENIEIENINGSVNVENNIGSVTVNNISGTVNASSSTGDIKVVFNKINQNQTMSFNTVTGNIDLTMPATSKADLKMRTEWGDIYSDLNVVTKPNEDGEFEKVNDQNGMRVISNNWTYGTLNGGGPEMTLKSQMGSIYLRAKE